MTRSGRPIQPFVALQRPEWQDRAACRGASRELAEKFHPHAGRHAVADVIRLCGRCLVRAECLEYALGFPATDQFGIWGGTSASQRKAMLLQRKGSAS